MIHHLVVLLGMWRCFSVIIVTQLILYLLLWCHMMSLQTMTE